MQDLPLLMAKLDKTDPVLVPVLQDLIQKSLTNTQPLTTKEERQTRRTIETLLTDAEIERADEIASTLVEIRVLEHIERYLPLFRSESAFDILQIVYAIGQIKVNMSNITLASDKTSKIVTALKSYSHVSGSDIPVMSSLEETLETVITLYSNQIKQGVELERNYEDLPLVPCFPDEIGQVWTNIITNAFQAMNLRGKITINLRAEGDYAVVEIIDNGPGIPEHIKHRIFEPFFTTKAQGEGTGLGLDITRKIIEKHHGNISVESEPGNTVFRVELPFAPMADIVDVETVTEAVPA